MESLYQLFASINAFFKALFTTNPLPISALTVPNHKASKLVIPHIDYNDEFKDYESTLNNLQRLLNSGGNTPLAQNRLRSSIEILKYLRENIIVTKNELYDFVRVHHEDQSEVIKKTDRWLKQLPVIVFDLPVHDAINRTKWRVNATTKYVLLVAIPPALGSTEYIARCAAFFVRKAIVFMHHKDHWFAFLMNTIAFHIDHAQMMNDHASIKRLKRIASLITSTRQQAKHGIRQITDNQIRQLIESDLEIKELQLNYMDETDSMDALNKWLVAAKKQVQCLKRKKEIAFNANDKNAYLLNLKLANAKQLYRKYDEHYNELILNKQNAKRRKRAKEIHRYLSLRNRGNRSNDDKVKFIPQLQVFLAQCLSHSYLFWSVDSRRRFSANLLSKDRNTRDDFKIYEQAFWKIVSENEDKIQDGYKEFEQFCSVEDVWQWLGQSVFENRIRSTRYIFN
eukprot:129566_1